MCWLLPFLLSWRPNWESLSLDMEWCFFTKDPSTELPSNIMFLHFHFQSTDTPFNIKFRCIELPPKTFFSLSFQSIIIWYHILSLLLHRITNLYQCRQCKQCKQWSILNRRVGIRICVSIYYQLYAHKPNVWDQEKTHSVCEYLDIRIFGSDYADITQCDTLCVLGKCTRLFGVYSNMRINILIFLM